MPLLILLSALMTALTGAITGVRAPELRVEQVQAVAVRTAAATVQALAPANPALLFASVSETPSAFRAVAPAQQVSRYSDRRRE